MNEKDTEQLLHILQTATKNDIPAYQADNLNTPLTFPLYIDALIRQKHLKRQDIFQKADIPQKYGYKLLSGESHTTDRDKLLRLFIAMHLTLKETNRALTLYGLSPLYPKIKRDAILIIALNQGISSVDTVNDWLIEHHESPLARIND